MDNDDVVIDWKHLFKLFDNDDIIDRFNILLHDKKDIDEDDMIKIIRLWNND